MKITCAIKIIPALLVTPFLLVGCEALNGLFDDTSRQGGYDSNYSSSATTRVVSQQSDSSVDNASSQETKPVAKNKTSSSGTAATTISVPVSTEKKTPAGTVDAPAVPSMAPTVGQ